MNKPIQQPATSAWSMYRAIVGIGALCALLIVTVYQTTAARIRENQAEFLATAVDRVLPAAQSTIAVAVAAGGRLEQSDGTADLPVFLGYDADGKLVGAVVTAQGMGYQDNVRVLYAYSFEHEAIVGMQVLDSKETPGLGDRIEKEPHFLANFERLDVSLSADGNALLHPIATVKQGAKVAAWQIDGITGATISSEAVGNILRESAGKWVPILRREAHTVAGSTTNGDQ